MSGDTIMAPYARALGIRFVPGETGETAPVLVIDFGQQVEGRPGFLHGGAIGGLLETAGYAVVAQALAERDHPPRLKPINVTVQFLSAGKPKPTYAVGRVVKLGRRVANVVVEAWQDERDRPIASAVMNIMLATDEVLAD